jgi:hypothetical protein
MEREANSASKADVLQRVKGESLEEKKARKQAIREMRRVGH